MTGERAQLTLVQICIRDEGAEEAGGFAIVAYPAEYGNSCVMIFMIKYDGTLVQKDLGKATDKVAAAMSEFNPDESWQIVERD